MPTFAFLLVQPSPYSISVPCSLGPLIREIVIGFVRVLADVSGMMGAGLSEEGSSLLLLCYWVYHNYWYLPILRIAYIHTHEDRAPTWVGRS